jgi:hypothetical protein
VLPRLRRVLSALPPQAETGGLPRLAACEEIEVGLGEGGRVLKRDVVTGRGDDGTADVAGHLRELFGYFVDEIGLRADGQDRAADRAGVVRAVLPYCA